MEGRNNGDRGSWRSQYRHHTTRGSGRSTSSSGYTSAGTIVSTGYTSSSSGRLSSSFSLKAAIHLDILELDEEERWLSQPTKKSRKETQKKEKEKMYHHQEVDIAQKEEEIRILVQQFFLGALSPSVDDDCSSLKAKGGDTSVLDWWLKHLRVGWVLDITDDYVSSGKLFELTSDDARSWILALAKISQTVRSMVPSLCRNRNSVGLPSICAEEEQQPETETRNKDSAPDLFQFTQFILEAMSKLLVFVDVIVAPNSKIVLQEQEVTGMNRRLLQLYHKLRTLLRVHNALSDDAVSATQYWLFQFGSRLPRGVERIYEKIVSILSGKAAKAAEGIWSTMEQIRMESSSCSQFAFLDVLDYKLSDTQGSSDVHKVTQFVVDYIKLLCSHRKSLVAIMCNKSASLGNMIREIASDLHETLVNISESFLNHGLKFLFLLNNSYLIRQELWYNFYSKYNFVFLETELTQVREEKLYVNLEGYKESYLQVSWAPVLSCLLNPTPLCFGRKYSLLPKFESEFLKTYTTQKLWKVPDPELRKTLRRAIIDKIVPGYTNYIEDNKITTPKFSPQELKEMLQELFEG